MALEAMSWIFMGRLLAVKAGGLGGTASCSRVDESSPFEREQRANRVRAARLQDECGSAEILVAGAAVRLQCFHQLGEGPAVAGG